MSLGWKVALRAAGYIRTAVRILSWYIEFSMEQDVFGENEAATSDAVDSEALWDTTETSLHIMESEGEEMSRGKCV